MAQPDETGALTGKAHDKLVASSREVSTHLQHQHALAAEGRRNRRCRGIVGSVAVAYLLLVLLCWRPLGVYGFLVFLLPTQFCWYVIHNLSLDKQVEHRWAGQRQVLCAGLGIYGVTGIAVAGGAIHPVIGAIGWPFLVLLLLAGDPAVAPRFDYESKHALATCGAVPWTTEAGLRRADEILSGILAEHDEYHNVWYQRAHARWRLGDRRGAIEDQRRGLDVQEAGGLFLHCDSDQPIALSDAHETLGYYETSSSDNGETAPSGR